MDHGSRVILTNTDHLEVTLEAEEREKSKDELAKKARLKKVVEQVLLGFWLSVLIIVLIGLAAGAVWVSVNKWSWTLNEDSCLWEALGAYPNDGKPYRWDEDTTSWVEVLSEA
jgi:hypothetical protein